MGNAIEEIFGLLEDWRKLPNYQLERRADIFFAYFLPDILRNELQINIRHNDIIPEFPLQKRALYGDEGNNQSNKVDYAIFDRANRKVYFVELKTEMNSRNDDQDKYLKAAQSHEINALLGGIIEISESKSVRRDKKTLDKYNHLLNKLKCVGAIAEKDNALELTDLYNCEKPKIIYIQPVKDIKDKDNETIITFARIAQILEEKESNPLSLIFAGLLKNIAKEAEKNK
ncbi:hypothetical protein FACS1894191_4980 [Clostridia bacterium]|nr:hypothetical protein FACS1894191_4980 [Clostridia bacterium]